MKNVCACLVIVVLQSIAGSCFAFNGEDAEAQGKQCWTADSQLACLAQVEAKALKRFASKASRNGLDLVIRTKAGNLSFHDVLSEDRQDVRYHYVGFLDGIGCHLVRRYYWEKTDYLLISDTTKRQTMMGNIPHVSPMYDRIVSVAASEMGGVDYQLQVWKVTPDGLMTEYKYSTRDYALYSFVAWVGNSTIRLENFTGKKEKVKKFCQKSASSVKINEILRLVGGEWRLSVATPPNARCDPQ
jgi:hypothetical protein